MGIVQRAVIALVGALLVAGESVAAPVKLGCVTEPVQQKPGIPTAWLVNFDEDAKTANLFVKDLGGHLNGSDVDIRADTIMFKFTTPDGKTGNAFVSRATGTLTVAVEGSPTVLANCRKLANAF
ncbi:MAG TPA: hypothetical protein PLB41_11120 [Rubrivivax sp.]|nr:hypothetical protein [Rubrivivax sp.]